MKHTVTTIFYFLFLPALISCNTGSGREDNAGESGRIPASEENMKKSASSITDMDNLLAWCIVPFDNQHRNPAERINMLRELGFKSYAYDWRHEHLDEMADEFRLAAENGIEIKAVWLWIDATVDKTGSLSEDNEKMLSTVKEAGLHTQIWTGFHPNYFGGLPDQDAVKKGVEMVGYLSDKVDSIGCNLALYNHGDWFGDPENQVKIIRALPDRNIGIVYNFHHAHDQVDRLPEIIRVIKPYLWVVNLNGMRIDGPKILPIGAGDMEKEMIDQFIEAGFTGPFGILGHIEDADVKLILEKNLEGLRSLYP